MNRDEFIYSRLAGASGLTALVGTRISPVTGVEFDERPYVTFLQIGGGVEYSHDGPDDFTEMHYQFDAWGRSFDEARAVAVEIVDALIADDPTVAYYLFVDNIASMYESDTRTYRRMIQARIWFAENNA